MEEVIIFWFRRDLRIEDNIGLQIALKENKHVLPLFIFDTNIMRKLDNKNDLRIYFIYKKLGELKKECEEWGSSLLVLEGTPLDVFKRICLKYKIQKVYSNEDYEPYSLERDQAIKLFLNDQKIGFFLSKDHVIFSPSEILKSDQSPYTIYTPFSNTWKKRLANPEPSTPLEYKYFKNFFKTAPFPIMPIEALGFRKSTFNFPDENIPNDIIQNYSKTRDYPHLEQGCTKLGLHLRFGTISIRKLVNIALQYDPCYLNELIWREFFISILFHFPKTAEESFRSKMRYFKWQNDDKMFEKWCKGQTGFPFVDAGMRQLNASGYMHNRLRMVVASFLTKHLLIDWRWGEAYFAKKLLDYEAASNIGNWQWAAGTGCDAAPFFRIFNPELQSQKFDPENIYTRKWIPELDTSDYPKPIVEHAFARQRALQAYQETKLHNKK